MSSEIWGVLPDYSKMVWNMLCGPQAAKFRLKTGKQQIREDLRKKKVWRGQRPISFLSLSFISLSPFLSPVSLSTPPSLLITMLWISLLDSFFIHTVFSIMSPFAFVTQILPHLNLICRKDKEQILSSHGFHVSCIVRESFHRKAEDGKHLCYNIPLYGPGVCSC